MIKKFLIQLSTALALSFLASAYNFNTVIIDPGHGGHDNGGRWGQVYEKHLALDTAVRLEAHLRKMGFNTVMTRRSDYFISLQARTALANKYRNSIFVSVHYNYTWKQHVSGIETFYSNGSSHKLAKYVHQGMMKRVRVVDRGVKFARYYVIKNTKIPAVLVEGGFVSNTSERNRMKTAAFRDALAYGVADGIRKFRRAW